MQDSNDTDSFDIPFTVPFVHRLRFTRDVFGADRDTLLSILAPSGDQPARVQFWIDETVLAANEWVRKAAESIVSDHPERIRRASNVQIVPGGEEVKNDIHILERMLKVMNTADLDRRSYVVAIGGGAMLDAVGFAASIAHRGIRIVRLPTTTLAQADSGVGVKNGVNLFGKKNWVGSFAVPWGVINDAKLLETLSPRDFRCGFAEAVKVSLLKDPLFFDEICSATDRIVERDPEATFPIIKSSARWHLQHITRGGDPFEAKEARPLDFGHWSAHKLESISQFRLRHGEAVAIGVAIDAIYSSLVHGLPVKDAHRIVDCLRQLGFTFDAPELLETEVLFRGLEEFRQHLGGRLTVTMLEEIGTPINVHEIDENRMREAIDIVAKIHSEIYRHSL